MCASFLQNNVFAFRLYFDDILFDDMNIFKSVHNKVSNKSTDVANQGALRGSLGG